MAKNTPGLFFVAPTVVFRLRYQDPQISCKTSAFRDIVIFENRKKRISTSKLNDTMLEIIKQNPPPAWKGKYVKIKFCTQLPTPTPQFAFFANLPQYVRDPYKRYLENKMRETFDFNGVPIVIYFRKK